MDLLSSIRKSGSRGGVNFSWDEVSTSQHRENYLGHSLMAPVGRWQKNRDLGWYAKGDSATNGDETAEDKKARERREEIKRIKEAEEDALARALGLPVAERGPPGGGAGSGANAISVGEMNRVIQETEDGDEEIDEVGRSGGFGQFVGRMGDDMERILAESEKGGLVRDGGEKEKTRDNSRERRHRRHRHRSRSGERRRHRHRSRSGERDKYRRRLNHEEQRSRSRSLDRRERRHRSRSGERFSIRRERDYREPRREDDRESRRDHDRRPRRSRSPGFQDGRNSRARRG
jgi:hypothetical protein